VRAALALAAITALVPASAPSAEGAGGAARPRVALSVSPAQLALTVPGSRRIRVRNEGAERVVVDVTQGTWLRIVPERLSLRSGDSAILTLRLRRPAHAEPGDHRAVVLLSTRPLRAGRVNVQVRLGLRVKMRVPGRIVRRLTLGTLNVRRKHGARVMLVSVANRGNVTVPLRGHVAASLLRPGRQPARLRVRARRALLPRARALIALRSSGGVHGRVIAVVRIRLGPGIRIVERRYRIRL
jgi:hypothetical protein